MIVEAQTARIKPDEEIAYLEEVRIRLVGAGADKGGLDMTCERGTFRFQTGDFLAEGNVRGRTGDGRDFRTERVRYLHEEHMAKTDDPVLIQDETGTYRGGGFEYFINQNRFRLLGGASVVQTQ
jgi:LPS export ABC transporter protein LptC